MSEPDPYTPYCDVYSFGVVIYELTSGQLPYSNMHERDLVSSNTEDVWLEAISLSESFSWYLTLTAH